MADFDAADMVQGIAELYEPLAEEKGLAFRVDVQGLLSMRGNRELLTQALANLVDNAIKYGFCDAASANGVPCEVMVSATNEGDKIKLCVADHGPGVPVADREHVVQRFVRLEQSRTQPGSGL